MVAKAGNRIDSNDRIAAAGFNGGSFLNYDQDFSSMLMAAFFAIAVVAYFFSSHLTLRGPTA